MCSIRAAAFLFFALLLAADIHAESVRRPKVAALLPLSGAVAFLGQEEQRGAALFIAEHSQGKGLPYEVVFDDHKLDTKAAVSAFKNFYENDGVRFFFTTGSGPSLGIKPLSERRGAMLFSTAAYPGLAKETVYTLQHSNVASDDARTLARAVAAHRPARVAALYLQND